MPSGRRKTPRKRRVLHEGALKLQNMLIDLTQPAALRTALARLLE